MKNLTFRELSEKWLSWRKNFVKESTYSTYAAHMRNHILPGVGDMKCDKLTEEELQQFIFDLVENGRKDGKGGLSEKTVKDIITILKSCLEYGRKSDCVPQMNYDLSLPATHRISKKGKVTVYTIREQQMINEAVQNNLNTRTNGLLFCLYTGVRIGELCALKWSDIDFDNNVVSISKTLQRIYIRNSDMDASIGGYSTIHISSPKTNTSNREIPISDSLMYTLKKLCPDDLDTYILTNDKNYIEPRTYRNFYTKFIESLNIRVLKFHSLRHSFATRLIEAGADYKTVSELLGHSSVNITLNLYVHPSLEQKRKCVELISM